MIESSSSSISGWSLQPTTYIRNEKLKAEKLTVRLAD